MIDCKKCVHYELCLDFVCSKEDMERDTDCDYFEEKRPHGEWIDCEDNNFCKCSICGNIVMIEEVTTYCGSCGAKMVKEGEAE